MSKEIKTTLVAYNEHGELDFKSPSNWYVRIATGDFLYIHTQKRQIAQKWVDEEFGKGKYVVRASDVEKTKNEPSARGTSTR